MISNRQIKFHVGFTSDEVIAALKLAYPHDIHVQALPDTINAKMGTLEAKVSGVCGIDLIYTKNATSSARDLVIARSQLSGAEGAIFEEFDPA